MFQQNTMILPTFYTNTKSLAKEFSKILILEYFGFLKTGGNVFFDAYSESPRMTYGKNATLRSYGRKTAYQVVT